MENLVYRDLAKRFLNTENQAIKNDLRLEVVNSMKKLTFSTIGSAKIQTGLSYLGSVNSSSKIVKNIKLNYNTYIIYMSPYNTSGYNTCSKASKGCAKACLNTSGRVKMDIKNNILVSRLLKTWLFYANRDFFNKWLFSEIEANYKKTIAKGLNFSVRINGTTDLNLELMKVNGVNVLEKFSDIQFYDYTKVYNRLEKLSNYKNYHLTFSYSGENNNEVIKALEKGFNVAFPFMISKKGDLPNKFMGYSVEDADKTDLRFLDKNRIAGLRVKITKDKNNIYEALKDGFIIDLKAA